MKNKKRTIMLAAILFLAIGFAAVSTTLYLNGAVGFSTNKADFDVRFIVAKLNDVDVSDTAISPDGKTIEFTAQLDNPQIPARLDYTILNNSSQYDAAVTIDCTNVKVVDPLTEDEVEPTQAQRGYLTITHDHENEFPIRAKETEDGYVNVKLNQSVTEDVTYKLYCTLDVDAVSRNTSGVINASEIAITGLEDLTYDGQPITSVDQALNYLYENR